MECNHNNTSKKMVSQDYFGLTFSCKMEVCNDCDARLWTAESKQKLNDWLQDLKKSNRDAFVVQANLSEHSKKCLHEILTEYPGTHLTTLIRAMTLVFLNSMERPEAADLLERSAEGEVYSSFHEGEKSITKVQFGPSGMLDISSWSKILQMKSAKIVEEAVYRITSLHVESDLKLKDFWENEILPQISLILKSAS